MKKHLKKRNEKKIEQNMKKVTFLQFYTNLYNLDASGSPQSQNPLP